MREPPRLLRALLRLYPRRHRDTYGAEMWDVVRYRYEASGGRGGARMRLFVEVAIDLVWSAARLRTTGLGRRMMGQGRGGWGLDVRFVLRALRRRPGYALTALAVLAGAVAVNASVFSYVRGTLLAEPTYPGADRMVLVWGSNPTEGQVRDVISGPDYLELARENGTLESIAAIHVESAGVPDADGHPQVYDAETVSASFFQVVPVEPALGRVFDARERNSGGERTVVVSWAFWRDHLGQDPTWLGRSLTIEGEPHTVIGVLPEDFQFLLPVAFWLPLYDDVLAADDPSHIHYNALGRMRPGVTAQDVTHDLAAVQRRTNERRGGSQGWTILAERLHDTSVMAVRGILWTVTAAMGLVLLIALVNLATLFRIRTLGRDDELGVRLALGASRGRVARILALESGILASGGAVLGLLVTPLVLARARELLPVWVPIPDSAARVPVLQAVLDPAVAGTSLGLALLGALALTVPGLLRAVRARGAARAGRGKIGSHGTRWLVAVELALATVLCLGAVLTTRSAARLLATDVGLQDQGLLTFWVGDVWDRPREDQVRYYRQIVAAVQEVPGVKSAALIDYVPFQGEDDFARVYFLDRSFQPVESQREEWRRVTEGLFETAGMSMVAGRSFESEDFQGPPLVAVVNQAFARKHYPQGAAVGQLISTHDDNYRNLRIVGVVSDVRSKGPANPATPMLYVPNQGSPRGTVGMYVRSSGAEPMALAPAVRDAVWSVDPTQLVANMLPMSSLVATWVAIPRAVRTLLSWVAALALGLAAVGVFGVVAYAVRSRTREIGVRLALGASPERLRREVLTGALPMVVLGVGGGLVLGLIAARGARALLYGVAPTDLVSLVTALVAISAAALLAIWIPARRASRIDPTEAIRSD